MLGEGGLFIISFSRSHSHSHSHSHSLIPVAINYFFGIAKNYVSLKPIYMVGLIDLKYIECYHNSIIPLEVLFLLCSYNISIDIMVD